MERKSECFFFFMFLGGFFVLKKKKIASSFLFILLNVGFFFFPLFFLPENYPEKNSTWINPFLEQNLRVTYLFTYLLIYLFILGFTWGNMKDFVFLTFLGGRKWKKSTWFTFTDFHTFSWKCLLVFHRWEKHKDIFSLHHFSSTSFQVVNTGEETV